MSRFVVVTNDSVFEQKVRRAVSGGLTGSLQTFNDVVLPETPDDMLRALTGEPAEVVLLGPGVAIEDALRLAAVFDVQLPAISLVLVAGTDPELALSAMRAGIRDILDPAAEPEMIRVLLERASRSAASRQRITHAPATGLVDEGRTIVIASPKGGVGKTTIATNIAVALGRVAPMSTVLVDLDAQFGDVASALQLEPEHTLLDAVTRAAKQDSMVLKTFLSVHHSSVYVLCAPQGPDEADRISADDISHLLRQLASEFRYVVIDTAPGLGEVALTALEHASDTVLLCTMDVPSVRGLRKEIDVLNQLGLAGKSQKIVVNLGTAGSGLSIRDIEATIGTSVDVVIPRAREVASSTNMGVPLLQNTKRGKAVTAMNHLAAGFDPSRAPKVTKGLHKRAELK